MKRLRLVATVVVILFLARTAFSQAGGLLQPPGPPQDGVGCSTCAILSNQPPSTPITSAGTVITNSGHYHLTKSFFQDGTDGIIVNADNVEIDLGGFTLDGKGDFYSGVKVIGNHTNIAILNGEIENYGKAAINAPGVTGLVVGEVAGPYTKGFAFFMQNTKGVLAGPDCKIYGATIAGDYVATNPAVQVGNDSTASDCRVMNWGTAAGACCYQSGNDCHFLRCTAEGGYSGFCSGINNTFESCNAYSNSNAGFSCDTGNVIRHCVSHDNGGDCFKLMENCLLEDSTATGCGKDGIDLVGNYCRVVNDKVDQCNTSNDTNSCGIAINASNNLIDNCFVTRSKRYGFYIFNPYTNNTVIRNFASGNVGPGFNYQAWNFATNNIGPQVTTVGTVQFTFPNLSLP